jgi:flagellar biogenesis protein FliO
LSAVSLIAGAVRAATDVATTATTVVSSSTSPTTVAASGGSTAKPVSATALIFQFGLGLLVVLALIWVASRIIRGRVSPATLRRRNAPLSVLSRQTLGKGVQLAVVKAGTDTWLLGVTSHQVTRLARFHPEENDAATPTTPSSDDLPGAPLAGRGASPVPFSLQSTVRSLQEKTLRRR